MGFALGMDGHPYMGKGLLFALFLLFGRFGILLLDII
jgi:hypothetical protein